MGPTCKSGLYNIFFDRVLHPRWNDHRHRPQDCSRRTRRATLKSPSHAITATDDRCPQIERPWRDWGRTDASFSLLEGGYFAPRVLSRQEHVSARISGRPMFSRMSSIVLRHTSTVCDTHMIIKVAALLPAELNLAGTVMRTSPLASILPRAIRKK